MDLIAATDHPPPRWVVRDLLPEGLTILAGKSGAGKSFLAYQLALTLGWVDFQFMYRDTADGESLYLDLEMSQRKSADRVRPMVAGQELYVPPGFKVCYDWPRFGPETGGMRAVDAYLTDHPDTRLVVVDVLSLLWDNTAQGSIYHREYQQLSALKQIANKHHTCILALHHTSKSDSDEPFDRISGSTAMQGAADCKWLLERRKGEAKGRLHVSGKEVVDSTLHVSWDGEARWWSLLEDDSSVVI